MKLHRITTVRYFEEQGRPLIERFLFKGMYGGPRVPRGVEPAVVARVIGEAVKPDSPPDTYRRTVDVVRFYELSEVVSQMLLLLSGNVVDGVELQRKAYAIQIAAELGTPDDAARAAAYFDDVLVPSRPAPKAFPLLMQTLESLAPAGSADKLFDRIQREVAALASKQRNSEADMMAHDKMAAVARNDWPKAKLGYDVKSKLAPQPPDARRESLVKMYLGTTSGSDAVTEIWAARMLRLEAMANDGDPICAEFAKVLDGIPVAKASDPNVGFIVARAAQAIVYLLGTLTPAQKDKLTTATGAANFLWDDPG